MIIAAIFAHPDDEAFGPGGTIATLSQENEVHLICATTGDRGENHHVDKAKPIGEIREEELRASAKILGVKSVTLLNFNDGTLCNNSYHELVSAIKVEIDKVRPDRLLTFEPRGVSGHLDHITISMVCSYIFEHSPAIKELWYYCISDAYRAKINDYFVYFPPGYKDNEINQTIDVESVWEQKINAIQAHRSQKKDGEQILSILSSIPHQEHFLVLKK